MLKELLMGVMDQQELLNNYNASISYIKLPNYIHGFVFYYKGIYSIAINEELSYYKKKKTILHELAHIELNQLCQANKDMFEFYIDKYEDDADKYISFLLKK